MSMKIKSILKPVITSKPKICEENKMYKRALTEDEIQDILSFLKPNPHLPSVCAETLVNQTITDIKNQLQRCLIYPEMIPELKRSLYFQYKSTIISPGLCVGIITAQSIGEQQTQKNLNTFHRAGSGDKQPTVSQFSELIGVTSKPKAPSFTIYLKERPKTVASVREISSYNLVQITFESIAKGFKTMKEKKPDAWYPAFAAIYGKKPDSYTACLSISVNMEVLYEYKLTLTKIAEIVNEKYVDLFCVFSPDCFATLDIYVNTTNIEIPEKYNSFLNEDNKIDIYLEEVVQPIIYKMVITGIPGILNMFYLKSGNEWYIETENSTNEMKDSNLFKSANEKNITSVMRYKIVLSLPSVDYVRTVSNNLWDIYYTFGIEATRHFMIEQMLKIMPGINKCHIQLLIDKMVFGGIPTSISRYSMRGEGTFARVSFEETLDNFLKSASEGQCEPISGVSASVICGKPASMGTGLCEIVLDMEKLKSS